MIKLLTLRFVSKRHCKTVDKQKLDHRQKIVPVSVKSHKDLKSQETLFQLFPCHSILQTSRLTFCVVQIVTMETKQSLNKLSFGTNHKIINLAREPKLFCLIWQVRVGQCLFSLRNSAATVVGTLKQQKAGTRLATFVVLVSVECLFYHLLGKVEFFIRTYGRICEIHCFSEFYHFLKNYKPAQVILSLEAAVLYGEFDFRVSWKNRVLVKATFSNWKKQSSNLPPLHTFQPSFSAKLEFLQVSC